MVWIRKKHPVNIKKSLRTDKADMLIIWCTCVQILNWYQKYIILGKMGQNTLILVFGSNVDCYKYLLNMIIYLLY